jgi:choline dehydrogenase-like flavoprotein
MRAVDLRRAKPMSDVVIVGGGAAGAVLANRLVDSLGAVNGTDALRVVDASIIPDVPSVAIDPTTIMIAERIARAVYTTGPRRRVHATPTV